MRMKVPLREGLATHTGLESCVAVRKAGHEALTKERAGRVLSLVNHWGADALGECGRPHLEGRKGEPGEDPTGSETLSMHGNNSRGNREIPCFSKGMVLLERIGASKDTSQ
jgi:hypothetical protein